MPNLPSLPLLFSRMFLFIALPGRGVRAIKKDGVSKLIQSTKAKSFMWISGQAGACHAVKKWHLRQNSGSCIKEKTWYLKQ